MPLLAIRDIIAPYGMPRQINFSQKFNVPFILQARQRNSAQSRPRLLVIRPPEGSGQPNRIVVLANQRPQPTNASPTLSTAISALQETAAVAQANLNRAFGKLQSFSTDHLVMFCHYGHSQQSIW